MARHPGRRSRYGAWQGGPDPLAPPYDVRSAVDQLGEEVLAGSSLRDALRDLLHRGPDGERGHGLDDLHERARRMRREALRRGRLDGTITRAQALLDQALAAEREALAQRADDDARFAEAQLDALPRSTSRAVQELSEYDWTSDEARADYQRILDELRDDVLGQRFEGMRDALQGADPARDPQAAAALQSMLADLNELLGQHARGEDTTDSFAEFMREHGEFFPEQPQDVDELVDLLARRAAAGERLMRSLTPSQRAELAGLMEQALGQAGVAEQMAALSENLRALRPDLSWGRGEQGRGEEPLGYGEATGALAEVAELDDLLDQLGQEHAGATLDDVDVEAVERQLGRGAADDVRRLRELERELRRQGWLSGSAADTVLSPKALRRLGSTALQRVFARIESASRGTHDVQSAGAAGEATGASRAWEFGDEQPLDVVRTVSNAVRRNASAAGGAVALAVEDFEVVETERRAGAAVALCVDMSFSMVSEGRWGPMKQTALALSHLVATQFPQDALQIIGFGRYALTLSAGELAAAEPDFVQGTNLQHALQLARRHLRKHSDGDPVVLVVTDGEPTAHLLPDGEAAFAWPPRAETLRATVDEIDQLTRYGAVLNVFMLGEDPSLRRFVDAMARRSGGRVFTPSAHDLGQYVVQDYLRARRGRRPGR
ncbi:vWA domain-containing protein [Angustibacter luteus]|uniref:VWA domain-containing protein n=1 Tax=Angustibacter luteus TaxID=658456 RepID=A0ABW1JAQ6_9ACTN